MIDQCGGMGAFIRRWKEAIDCARRSGRWASVLRAFALIADMTKIVQDLTPGLDTLSDDELAVRMNCRVAELIKRHPELAVQAAAKLGWQVTPTDLTQENAVSDR